MINRPNNWNEVQEFSDKPKLPLGAYVCKIRKATVMDSGFGDQLCMAFDISEGEFKGFFDNEFKSNQAATKKYKGVIRQWVPKDDGSEKDEWTKRSFKGMVSAFERSNFGFQWNWDEASLNGKTVGILFRNEEWEYEGKSGWAVRPFKIIDADRVRSGDFKLPDNKPLKNKNVSDFGAMNQGYSQTNQQDFTVIADDEDLPF